MRTTTKPISMHAVYTLQNVEAISLSPLNLYFYSYMHAHYTHACYIKQPS